MTQIQEELFIFKKFEDEKSCYTVLKNFGNRKGLDLLLPVAKIEIIDNGQNVTTFLTHLTLIEDEKNFILEKASSLY